MGHFIDEDFDENGNFKYSDDAYINIALASQTYNDAETAFQLGIITLEERNYLQSEAHYLANYERDLEQYRFLANVYLTIVDAVVMYEPTPISIDDNDPINKIYSPENYALILGAVPNPYGAKGDLDHQKAVKELYDEAIEKYPNSEKYQVIRDRSIKGASNSGYWNARPDVWVKDIKTGEVVEAFEAVRVNTKGQLVKREITKGIKYMGKGIKWTYRFVIKAIK
jgi:hypothetical protein